MSNNASISIEWTIIRSQLDNPKESRKSIVKYEKKDSLVPLSCAHSVHIKSLKCGALLSKLDSFYRLTCRKDAVDTQLPRDSAQYH